MSKNQKTTIFLVDDDPMFMKSMENDLLQNSHFKIKTFGTGEEVLKSVGEKPDIIFLDYYLNAIDPKAMNGLQTLKKIKALSSEIPIVMLSSQDRLEVAVNCMKHEAFDYIVKSEAAYMRANNVIKNIFKYRELEKDARFYKRTGITTFVFISVLILFFFIMSMFFPGVLKTYFASPGWL